MDAAPGERRDFWNRIGDFPPEVAGWRKRLLGKWLKARTVHPGDRHWRRDQLQERLDSGISHLREVAADSRGAVRPPDSGTRPTLPTNWSTSFSPATLGRGHTSRPSKAMKRRFRTWDELLDAPCRGRKPRLLGRAVGEEGRSFTGLGKIRETFGSCTLEPAREWSDEKLEAFLCGLPEIQRKAPTA